MGWDTWSLSLSACHAKKILGGTNGIDLRTTGDYFGFHELEQRTTKLIICRKNFYLAVSNITAACPFQHANQLVSRLILAATE